MRDISGLGSGRGGGSGEGVWEKGGGAIHHGVGVGQLLELMVGFSCDLINFVSSCFQCGVVWWC